MMENMKQSIKSTENEKFSFFCTKETQTLNIDRGY